MDDDAFLAAFEAAAIPSDRWTHRDHVRMAFLYLRDQPFDDALDRIRSGIQALNAANGIVDTPTFGYHETLTVAWARLVAAALHHYGPRDDFAAFEAANPHLLTRSLLRIFYSRQRIFDANARSSWVEPDLATLPDASG